MNRGVAVGNLLQAAVFFFGARYLWPLWSVAAGLAAVGGFFQLVAAIAVMRGNTRGARLASLLTLIAAAALFAGVAQSASSVSSRFGAEAADIAWQTLGGAAVALPWLVGWPLWQTLAGRPSPVGPVVAALVAGGLAWSGGAVASRPAMVWPEQSDLVSASQAAYSRWTGDDTMSEIPQGQGPAVVLLTPWRGGRPGDTQRGDGPNLAAAVEAALAKMSAPAGSDVALVMDLARVQWDGGAVPPGEGGGLGKNAGRSPTALWRPDKVKRRVVLPEWSPPQVDLGGMAPVRFDSVVVDSDGPRRLAAGWPEPPPLDAETARATALAGGRMIAYHQDADGRYAYEIKGPSGKEGSGYNFPRHAGATWFLARLAERTGDAEITRAASLGLDYLVTNTTTLSDGRGFVRDPTRRDTKVWVGTTALAALAAVSVGHDVAGPWGAFLASSIDEQGAVRGEMDLKTGLFPPQALNSYGEGQTLLALAALVRAGHEELREPLERGARFVDSAYAPGGAGRLVVLDEHWSCLAALTMSEVLGHPYGAAMCRAYLHTQSKNTPATGALVHISTGGAGGLAEAVVAGAYLDPDGPARDRALSFGRLFVREAYREADSPFLERPAALIGGFRDGPGAWDVRVDAVQHIGCALLGVEALLSQVGAGSLP